MDAPCCLRYSKELFLDNIKTAMEDVVIANHQDDITGTPSFPHPLSRNRHCTPHRQHGRCPPPPPPHRLTKHRLTKARICSFTMTSM